MEWERGRRLLPPCVAPLPKLLPHRGDESGLECPAGALEGSGIHSPPGQVGVGWGGVVWPGPGETVGRGGRRQALASLLGPERAGGLHREPLPCRLAPPPGERMGRCWEGQARGLT